MMPVVMALSSERLSRLAVMIGLEAKVLPNEIIDKTEPVDVVVIVILVVPWMHHFFVPVSKAHPNGGPPPPDCANEIEAISKTMANDRPLSLFWDIIS